MLWLCHDREGAKRNYRKAIGFAEGASAADSNRKELLAAASGLEPVSMGPLLDQILNDASENLTVLE